MRRFRFSIASLLGVVLFVAVAIAALRTSSDAWDSGVIGLALLILLTSVLLAVHRSGRRRAYWLGFALFGWTYLIASLIPPIGSRLPTTMGLTFIDSKVPGREVTISAVFTYTNTSTASTNPVQGYVVPPQGNAVVPSPPAISTPIVVRFLNATTGKLLAGPGGTTENFLRIGHSLLARVLAFLGGHLSRRLHGRGREDSAIPPSDSPASL